MILQLLKNEVVFAQTGGDVRHNCLMRLIDAVDYDTASSMLEACLMRLLDAVDHDTASSMLEESSTLTHFNTEEARNMGHRTTVHSIQ